jgi:hypothetical protein
MNSSSSSSQQQLRQFYVNQRYFQDSVVQQQLEAPGLASATGLLLGARDATTPASDKLFIFDALITPNPEDTQSDVQPSDGSTSSNSKNLMQRLGTKYQDFSYTDWLVEFAHSV